MAILRATHPISFHLLDRQGNQVIGIFDNKQGQISTLEITNRARRNLRLKQLAGPASATNHHFELKFRPDTLNLSGTPKITVADSEWTISDPTPTDGGVSLYLLRTTAVVLESGTTAKVNLNGLNADSKGGSRGTRMELKWAQGPLEYAANGSGTQPETLAAGHRLQHLEIVNERGQQYIPLHVAFVGTNQVLNNESVNKLTLRISNQLKEGNIELIKEGTKEYSTSTFILSFDASDKEQWTMGSVTRVKAFTINAVAGDKKFKVTPEREALSPTWTLTPIENITLKAGEFVEVTIENVITNYQAGETNLYLRYKNIPGYWDGEWVTPVEKSPIFFAKSLVGVWTNDPQARLHVNGNLRVENGVSISSGSAFDVNSDVSGGRFKIAPNGKVGIGTNDPKDKLHLMGTARIEGGDIFFKDLGEIKSYDDKHRIMFRRGEKKLEFREEGDIVFSPGSTDGNEKAKAVMLSSGKVGIGTTSPRTELEINGGLRIEKSFSMGGADSFEVDAPSDPGGRFKVEAGGNVGIGTSGPGFFSNTLKDYFRADKDGRILEVQSMQHESVLILSSGQDTNDAHLGGVYFTRVRGNPGGHREVSAIRCVQSGTGEFSGGHLQFFSRPSGAGTLLNRPRMVIHGNGNVGIGTADPNKAALEVATSANSKAKPYLSLTLVQLTRETGEPTLPYSIWAERHVAALQFDAFSDARLKNIHGRSDGAADLATLLGIEITDYGFKDIIGKGAGTHKKVIGQQVEKVFPQAVSRQTDCVPDIYARASIQNGWIALATDLKRGERVKLITEKGEGVYEVLEVTDDKFRVGSDLEGELEGENVFVFGREVDDFLSVDYDAISMLNVSATQQLKKEMDQELKALRVENAELRAANDALNKRLQLLESKLEAVVGVMSAAANGSNGTEDTDRVVNVNRLFTATV